ncbi:MAG: hypothetical protein PBU96_18980 [Stenotrophomonas geniculata]
MTVYKIINPSDPYHLTADDLVLAAIAACLLGHGKYALEATDGSGGVPLFLFGGHDEWFAAQGAGSFDEALTAATGQRAEALAKVLESVTIVGTRSSLNDIGEAAARLAVGVRKMVAQAHERTPYDAMGPVDAPNPPAARAPLADVQPGWRVRRGDQAERARFESWATAQGLDPSVRLMLTSHPPQDGGYADNWLQRLWQAWQAALSAQPSPGGQDALDCIGRIEEAIEFRVPHDIYAAVHGELAELKAALAARQPVSETVAYQQGFRHGQDRTCTVAASQPMGEPVSEAIEQLADDVESCVSDACGYLASDSGWDDYGIYRDDAAARYRALPDRVRALAAPPAQAVDLERFRGTVRSHHSMTEWMHRCGFVSAEKLEDSKKNHDHLLALIDSQAVGK